MKYSSLYDVPVVTLDGKPSTLAPYQGKVLLIVNLASRCGFTPQYAKLEALQQAYQSQGVTVLGFPSNQFHQEPGNNQDIKAFAERCYRVTFPLFDKIKVNGSERAPLYTYLAEHIEKKPWKLVPWNFTKILVDQNGRVLKRFLPTTSFKTIRKALDELIGDASRA